MIDQENKLNKYFLENDWNVTYLSDGGIEAIKMMDFPHLAGEINPKGTRRVQIIIDGGWRYPDLHLGFRSVDIDLREYEDAESAVVALVNKAYGEF